MLPLILLLAILLCLCLYQRAYGKVLLNKPMNILLEASHFADNILDDLWWKFLQDLIFGSSQDERSNSLFKAF